MSRVAIRPVAALVGEILTLLLLTYAHDPAGLAFALTPNASGRRRAKLMARKPTAY